MSCETLNSTPSSQSQLVQRNLFPLTRSSIRTSFRSLHAFASVSVGTGKSQVKFTVHKDLLTAVSPFFAAALDGAFAEGIDQSVTLPEEKPEIFEWFLQWLYTGSLTTPESPNCTSASSRNAATTLGTYRGSHVHASLIRNTTTSDGDLRNSQGSPKYFLLLDLYGLSDRLLTASLSNHVLDTLARLSEATNSVPTPSDTWILYDTIRETAPARALVLDLFCYKKTDKLLETHRDEWHPRFLRDLVVKLKRPGPEVLDRHGLVAWRVGSWPSTRACEGCRECVKPGTPAERCEVCERVFCAPCVKLGRIGFLGAEVGACKPWLRGMCARYHEHGEGEVKCLGM